MADKPLKPGEKSELKVLVDKMIQLGKLSKELANKKKDLKTFGVVDKTGKQKDLLTDMQQKVADQYAMLKASYDALVNKPDVKPKGKKEVTSSKLVEVLKTECSDVIRAMKSTDQGLFRGSKNAGEVFVGRPRENRNPLDSQRADQVLYDNYLTALGIVAQRHNSLFVSNLYGVANEYAERHGGVVYVIFPKNGFKFSWSQEHQDIVIELDHILNKKYINALEKTVWSYAMKFKGAKADKILDQIRYFFTQMHSYPKMSTYEVLVTFLKKIKFPDVDQVTTDIVFPVANFHKEFQCTDKNFKAALQSGHEILIHGEYIAVQETLFTKIQEQLGLDLSY
jgi:ribosomal protein L17